MSTPPVSGDVVPGSSVLASLSLSPRSWPLTKRKRPSRPDLVNQWHAGSNTRGREQVLDRVLSAEGAGLELRVDL